MRGGSWVPVVAAPVRSGLSPRARGKLESRETVAHNARSIPACAGEARSSLATPPWWRVYPRVRGGSLPLALLARLLMGLSPRARGKPVAPSSA